MKRLIVAIVLMVYGLASTGAVVHLEYCCGKLSDISLEAAKKEDCKEKTVAGKSCCASEQIHLKVSGEQELVVKWSSSLKHSIVIPAAIFAVSEQPAVYTPINKFSTGPPPNYSKVPLYLQHSLLLI